MLAQTFGHARHEGGHHVEVVRHDEPFEPQPLRHGGADIHGIARAALAVLRDHSAEDEAGERLGDGDRGREVAAADVVEIAVDAVRGRLGERRRQVALGLVVDRRVDADVAQEGAFLRASGRGHDRRTLDPGDLAGCRADRSGPSGDEEGLTGLDPCDVFQADEAGQPRQAGDAEQRLGRQARVGKRPEGTGRRVEDLAPAQHRLHEVAFGEAGAPRRDHPADRPALQRLAQLEGRHVAVHPRHPAPHVGIDGHPKIADPNLSVGQRRHGHLGQLERVQRRPVFRPAREADLARDRRLRRHDCAPACAPAARRGARLMPRAARARS